MILLDYKTTFISKFDLCLAKETLDNLSQDFSYNILNINENSITFNVVKKNILSHNSFLPIVKFDFSTEGEITTINAIFKLKKPANIFIYIYCGIALILELCLVFSYVQNKWSTPFLLLLPVALAFYVWMLSFFGMRIMANRIINQFKG